jgi:hypothetical protein
MSKCVIINKRNYNIFKEYIENLNIEIIEENNENIEKYDEIYLIKCNTDHLISKYKNKNIIIIYLEQLSIINNLLEVKNLIMNNINVITYNIYNYNLIENKEKIKYVPYIFNEVENNILYNLSKKTSKTYDIAFCGYIEKNTRRYNLIKKLKRKYKINLIKKYGIERDIEIYKAKIFLNIHFKDDYKINENLRCDRLVINNQLLLTENSLCDNLSDLKDLLIIEKYDKLEEKIDDIIKNYDKYYNLYSENLKKLRDSIIINRKKYLL